jgi:5-methylcytosine-specific restriction endonuclease McrA
VWLSQGSKCKSCDKEITLTESQADHINEYNEGGQTTQDNCQILCNECHKEKTKKYVSKVN